MKTAPGSVEVEPLDPDNPAERWVKVIKRRMDRGDSREEAVKRIQEWIAEQEELAEQTKPFMEKHGLGTKQELREAAVKWVLSNPDMHTVCVGMRDFDTIGRFLRLSGTKLARNEAAALDHYRIAGSSRYCRHGCVECVASCPHDVPVSRVMRYAYYFAEQGREKLAMSKYSGLEGGDGSSCIGCSGHCAGACPHGVNIQANLLTAHDLLTLA
jgi:predicted aldo/keto reductase-like oxidoreductase